MSLLVVDREPALLACAASQQPSTNSMQAIRTAVEDNLRLMRADLCRYRDILKVAKGRPSTDASRRQLTSALEMFQRRLTAIVLVIRRSGSTLPAANASALDALEKHTKVRVSALSARSVTEDALDTLIWVEGVLRRAAKNLIPVVNPSGID